MLDDVAHAIGFVVLELQELELSLAQYWVITRANIRGAGAADAAPVLAEADTKTLGWLLNSLARAGHIEPPLAEALRTMVDERNWIVHRSRRDNRGIMNSWERCAALLERLKAAERKSTQLREHVAGLVVRQAAAAGVRHDYVDREAERLVREWGYPE